jgi:hypothetical protein
MKETPIEGCTDDAECERIDAQVQLDLGSTVDFAFKCQDDPYMPGPRQCIMQCQSTDECLLGSVCSGGRCLTGDIPPSECVSALQQYEVFAGDNYVVMGSQQGYLHPWIVSTDPADEGLCVKDPSASPLDVSRFRRDVAACVDDTLVSFAPNACSVDIPDEPVSSEGGPLGSRETHAVRIRTRGMRLDIVDVKLDTPAAWNTPGKTYSPAPDRWAMRFEIGGGFSPRYISLNAYLPHRVEEAPDGSLWILDAGDSITSAEPQGKMIHFFATPDGIGELPIQ